MTEQDKQQVEPEELADSPVEDETVENAEVIEEVALQKELAESKERYMRLAAEFENFKKRSAREYTGLIESANDRLIIQLLDVVDNFDRALDMTEKKMQEETAAQSKLFDSLHEGARMIHQQLADILKSHSVAEIDPLGEEFDPELHEAVLQIPSQEHAEDVVAQVIAKGYHKNGRVLRHARVGVSKPANNEN
jgi:molecular chaperone GrpE